MLRGSCRGMTVVALAAGLCLPAFAQERSASGREFTASEHLMHHIIASHYGLTHQQVMDLHARGHGYEDIATAANIAARSGRPLSEVVALRDQRMEWSAISDRYGVAAADVTRPYYRYSGPEAVMYEYNFYQVHAGIPVADYERYRKMGYTPREIAMAYNVSHRTGREPGTVFRMLDRGMTWDQIAREHNLAMSDVQMPVTRVAGARETMGAMGAEPMRGGSAYAMPNTKINWSRNYELTPLEYKRLDAMGLSHREIVVAANAARISGRSVDEFAQMIFRGQTVHQISDGLNVPASILEQENPMWKTPEWERGVREGMWYVPTPSMSPAMQRPVPPTR